MKAKIYYTQNNKCSDEEFNYIISERSKLAQKKKIQEYVRLAGKSDPVGIV